MKLAKQSIRAQLEQQAKAKQLANRPQDTSIKKQFNKDPLRLNWKDVAIFSLLLVFSCGYWLQSSDLMTSESGYIVNKAAR